jgi:hypothetical protein
MKHATPPRIFPRRNTLLNSCRALLGGSLLACGLHSGFAESPAPAAASNSVLLHAAPLPLVASPQLTEPLGAAWKIHHGQWTPENGELRAAEIPQEKHSAVLHHRVGLKNAVVELEFRLEGAGYFGVGCDGPPHVGRVIVLQNRIQIAQDSKSTPKILAVREMQVRAGEWHHLRVEWKEDQVAARLDGQELRAQHDYFSTRKGLTWIGAGPAGATIRNLRIYGEENPAK